MTHGPLNGSALTLAELASADDELVYATRAEDWRCQGCNRGMADGAKPGFHDTPNHVATRTRNGHVFGRWCMRCAKRTERGVPHDMPPNPRGSPLPKSKFERVGMRASLRTYWERQVFNAAMRMCEMETGEEHDPAFAEARRAYFKLIATAGKYLRREDYEGGAVPGSLRTVQQAR